MAWLVQNDSDLQAIQNQQDSQNSLAKVVMDNWIALIICWQNWGICIIANNSCVYINNSGKVKTKEHPCSGGMITDYIPAVPIPRLIF